MDPAMEDAAAVGMSSPTGSSKDGGQASDTKSHTDDVENDNYKGMKRKSGFIVLILNKIVLSSSLADLDTV